MKVKILFFILVTLLASSSFSNCKNVFEPFVEINDKALFYEKIKIFAKEAGILFSDIKKAKARMEKL